MNSDQMLKQVFEDGRTHRIFTDAPVDEGLLHRLYDLAKMAPSASNLCPMRITFVQSKTQKQKVIEAAAEGNKPKIDSAPVVAIIAHDAKFYNHIEKLAPHMNADAFRQQEKHTLEQIAIENCWLQAGFFIAAARSLGLDCGPMSGFDKARIDEGFYQGSSWRSDFLMNLGYGDASKLHPRGHRLNFDEACSIL
ncbi:MAG: malonic semialdehyde reductase [Alphaproteobacteria bacterium]|nr:malonic semialdehyde reductase [Alphaproteobacteria bacterium]